MKKMDLNLARALAENLMERHNLVDWKFGFDRAKRRFGSCHYDEKKISLSRHLVEINEKKSVEQTILHEIAHALCGARAGHGAGWRAKVVEIGGVASRCFDPQKIKIPPPKYTAICPNCQKTFPAQKKYTAACRACCTKFNRGRFSAKFQIVFRGYLEE